MTEALVQYQAQDLALPDAEFLTRELQAIKKFQQLVHANLIEGQDYGVIPGTTKPTLLQPGAQKVTKLLGLTDHYQILNSVENWDKPFFRYLIKCELRSVRTGVTISECIAECNSYESRYRYRWLFISQLPDGFVRQGAVSREVNLKAGGKTTQYRVDNDDIYSQVNTLVKMANKRGLVGAALSAGRLSEIFTQDMEDIGTDEAIEGTVRPAEEAPFAGPRCPTHPTRTPQEWGGRGNIPKVWKCTGKTGAGPKDFCTWTAPRGEAHEVPVVLGTDSDPTADKPFETGSRANPPQNAPEAQQTQDEVASVPSEAQDWITLLGDATSRDQVKSEYNSYLAGKYRHQAVDDAYQARMRALTAPQPVKG